MKKLGVIGVLLIVLVTVFAFKQQLPELVSPAIFSKQLNKNVVLVDVRTVEEFNQGHLINALNIDYYGNHFVDEMNKLNKNDKVMIYCKSGGRSAQAVTILKQNGFIKIVELDGGYMAWNKAKLPTQK